MLRRSFAAFLGLWFLLVMIEPAAVHSCPVHSSVTGTHAGHSAAMKGAHHNMSADASSSTNAPKTADASCSCPGDCAATSVAVLVSRVAVLPIPATLLRAVSSVDRESTIADHPDLILPFAIGPPASAAA